MVQDGPCKGVFGACRLVCSAKSTPLCRTWISWSLPSTKSAAGLICRSRGKCGRARFLRVRFLGRRHPEFVGGAKDGWCPSTTGRSPSWACPTGRPWACPWCLSPGQSQPMCGSQLSLFGFAARGTTGSSVYRARIRSWLDNS